MKEMPKYRHCFVCGDSNIAGTDMTWVHAGDSVQGKFIGDQKHIGFEGIIHGGIVSSLLDECVGWAVAIKLRRICMTGELTIKFLKSVPVGKQLTIIGKSPNKPSNNKKYHTGSGSIVDDEGAVYATCKGKFFPMPEEIEKYVLAQLHIPGNEDKLISPSDLWD